MTDAAAAPDLAALQHAVRITRVIGLVVLALSLVLLFALPITVLIQPDLRRALLVVAVVVGALGWARELWSPTLPAILVGALALALAATAVSAWASQHPSTAFFGLWLSAAYSGIAILIWRWLQREGARSDAIVVVGLVGFLIVSGTYLLNVVGQWMDWAALGMQAADFPFRPGSVGGIVPGPTWTSDYAVLLAPLAFVSPRLLMTRGRRIAQVLIVALAVATVAMGAVRALWVAVAIVLGVVAIVVVWQHRSSLMSKRRESIALALAGSVAMGAGLVFAIPRMGGLLRNADEGRVSAFAAAVQIFRHFPLVGSGPGSYATERMAYPAEALSQLTLPDPHNGILAALSDTGLAGVVTLLIVAFVVVRLLARGLRTSDRSFAVAAVVGIAAISLHRMMDLVFMLPGLLIASMFVIGIAMRSRPDRRESRRTRLAATAFAAVALTLTVASAPKVITAEQGFDAYRVATAAWDAGDVRGAAGLAGDSLAQAPDLVPSQQLASMIALREGRADDAVDHAADAARREPMAQNLVRLATALSTAGRLDESGEMLARATAVKPADPVALLNAAMRGPASDRGPTLQHLLEVEPELAAFGDSMPNVSAADFTAAIESAHASLFAAGSTSQALRLALAAEREDLAQADVEAMSGPSQTVARLLMQGWFGDVEAASNLDTLATAEPDLASDAAYRLAVRSCDETNADRWASVITVQYGAPPAIIVGVAAAPALRTGAYPDRYPVWVWSVFGTTPAYPDGMWGIDWRSGVTCLTAAAH